MAQFSKKYFSQERGWQNEQYFFHLWGVPPPHTWQSCINKFHWTHQSWPSISAGENVFILFYNTLALPLFRRTADLWEKCLMVSESSWPFCLPELTQTLQIGKYWNNKFAHGFPKRLHFCKHFGVIVLPLIFL